MLVVGLTGNIASGKSTVAAALVARGAPLIDSDAASRAAVAPGTAALSAIAARFGRDVLLPDGALDRARLGALVFSDPSARTALEQIVHPIVEVARQTALADARAHGAPIVVCDIPLLFEAGLAWQFPRILLVDAPASLRTTRLVEGRGLSGTDAAARVAAQLPSSLKRGRADIVIDNDDSRAALDVRIDTLWQRLERWAAVAEWHGRV